MMDTRVKPAYDGVRRQLLLKPHRLRDPRPRSAVAVDLVGVVGITERDPAYHAAVVGNRKMPRDQAGMPAQRGLSDAAKPERVRGKHEIVDIGAAIDRAVNTERLVGMDH